MSKYYHRGREARMHGKGRIITDGRMSVASRKDWYAGWDEEDRQRQPVPTPEQAQEQEEALAGIRAFLDQARNPNAQ